MMIILALFGLFAGLVVKFLGIRGCVIMLPALYLLFEYTLPLTIGAITLVK